MALLGRTRSGEANFVETRRIEMLDRTLQSSGRLSFKAPDSFVRETLKPRHEKLAVDGNTLTMSLGERSRTMQLDASPEAAVIVEAIRGTLTGNRATLERLFETTVSGDASAWMLKLVPRDLRLRGQVSAVEVSGREAMTREVQVQLADGDRSVMTIEPVASRGPS
jgi:outer membrane lipoprotein-sorting protein